MRNVGYLNFKLPVFQKTDVMNKVANFQGKKFFIAHGTADGESDSENNITFLYARNKLLRKVKFIMCCM